MKTLTLTLLLLAAAAGAGCTADKNGVIRIKGLSGYHPDQHLQPGQTLSADNPFGLDTGGDPYFSGARPH